MTLSGADAVEILDRLNSAGVWYCLEGGWGVDALLQEQTRRHDDLDLGVLLEEVERVRASLSESERIWTSGRRGSCSRTNAAAGSTAIP